eukprot:11536151-Heterocapsa_arctica.AAC.1
MGPCGGQYKANGRHIATDLCQDPGEKGQWSHSDVLNGGWLICVKDGCLATTTKRTRFRALPDGGWIKSLMKSLDHLIVTFSRPDTNRP